MIFVDFIMPSIMYIIMPIVTHIIVPIMMPRRPNRRRIALFFASFRQKSYEFAKFFASFRQNTY